MLTKKQIKIRVQESINYYQKKIELEKDIELRNEYACFINELENIIEEWVTSCDNCEHLTWSKQCGISGKLRFVENPKESRCYFYYPIAEKKEV